jgi:hypothetical protein
MILTLKITFRKLDILPSSGKKGRAKTLDVGPPGLRLAQSGGPTARVFVLPF